MKVLRSKQGSDEWFAARRGIPTASEFSRIITPKTGKLSAGVDLYIAELIAQAAGFDDAWQGSYWADRGLMLEDEAIAWYEFEHEVSVDRIGMIIREDGAVAGSPDGLIDEDGGIEVKCPMAKNHILTMMAGDMPDKHKPQVHGLLYLSGRKWWDYLSYCPDFEPLLIRVEPDEYTVKVGEALEVFLLRFAQAKKLVYRPLGCAA